MFNDVIGHDRQKGVLAKSAIDGSVAHAYIFAGPEGIGKKPVAAGFAKLLNCTAKHLPENIPDAECSCVSCTKIDKGIHPDLIVIRFEGVKSIKVEQIREDIEDRIYLKPYEGKYKIVIVDEAERMSNSAQNAFLKTLEEPPPDSVIILITSEPNSLLPTIRSRCRIIQFSPLPEELVLEFLLNNTEMSPGDAAVAARVCDGSPGQALRLNADSLELRKEFILALSELSRDSASRITGLVEALPLGNSQEDFENLKLAFKFMSLWLRDIAMLKIGYGDDVISHPDIAGVSLEIAAKWAMDRIMAKQKHVEDTWRDISKANANKHLAMESLFIKLAEN